MLTLNRGLDRYGVISDLKTESSHRAIVLSADIHELLKLRIRSKKKNKLKYRELFTDNDFLFTHEDGSIILPSIYSKAFKRLIRTHNKEVELNTNNSYQNRNLEEIRLYDCRHSFATNLLSDGDTPIKVISEVMGHSSVKTTLHNYAHVSQTMHAQALNSYSDKLLNKNKCDIV